MQNNILVYDLNRENWKPFVKDFSGNNARLKGQSGSEGVLKQRVNMADKTFKLKLDKYGIPVQSDIRKACISHLMRSMPDQLPSIHIKSTTFEQGTGYLSKVTFNLNSENYIRYFAFVLDNGVPKILPESEWKKHLSNAVLEDEIRLVDETEKSEILGLIRSIISEQIAKIESREKQFMDRRKKRLMYVLRRIDDTESHIYRRISKTIEAVDDKFNSMQITDLDMNLLGVMEG